MASVIAQELHGVIDSIDALSRFRLSEVRKMDTPWDVEMIPSSNGVKLSIEGYDPTEPDHTTCEIKQIVQCLTGTPELLSKLRLPSRQRFNFPHLRIAVVLKATSRLPLQRSVHRTHDAKRPL